MTEDEEDIPTNTHWLVRNILQEHATDNLDWERKTSKWERVANTFVAQEKTKAVEAVLEDLEQDLIAEMYASDHKFTKSDVVWNQALQFAIDRLRTYSKE